jgi:hypothetical protein
MCRHLRLLSLFLVVFVAPALALPAPMSDQDLMDTSDLVALVRVLSVTCTTVTKDEQTGEELPGYLAKLKLLEVKKGDATSRLDGPTRNFEFQTWSVVSSCAFNCVEQDITPPGRYPLDFPCEVGSIQPTSMPSTSRRLSAATTSIPMSLSS